MKTLVLRKIAASRISVSMEFLISSINAYQNVFNSFLLENGGHRKYSNEKKNHLNHGQIIYADDKIVYDKNCGELFPFLSLRMWCTLHTVYDARTANAFIYYTLFHLSNSAVKKFPVKIDASPVPIVRIFTI